jgi:hypothetical protein
VSQPGPGAIYYLKSNIQSINQPRQSSSSPLRRRRRRRPCPSPSLLYTVDRTHNLTRFLL